MTPDERLDEVLRAPIGAHVPVPGLRTVERAGWYQVLRSGATEGSNEIVCSVLAAADAERVIDETWGTYRDLGVRFKWVIGPRTEPSDMGDRLLRRGFESWAARGMCCEPALPIEVPAGISVEPLTEATTDAYARVMAEGWDTDLEPMRADIRAMVRSPRHVGFLARRGDEIVGAAGLVHHPRSVYLVGAVVLPRYRGIGAYRALLRARLAHAVEAGVDLVTTHAREQSSAPILDRFGFETVCRFTVLRSP